MAIQVFSGWPFSDVQKLMKRPKIGSHDFLRDFSGFFKNCAETMPYVKGLTILCDSKENYELLSLKNLMNLESIQALND